MKFRVLRAHDFDTPLALNGTKKSSTSQHWRCIKISLPLSARANFRVNICWDAFDGGERGGGGGREDL